MLQLIMRLESDQNEYTSFAAKLNIHDERRLEASESSSVETRVLMDLHEICSDSNLCTVTDLQELRMDLNLIHKMQRERERKQENYWSWSWSSCMS